MTDIDQLKEDFTELSDAVPRVPDEVNALRESAQHLADEATTLLTEADLARQEVASILAHVRNTLPGFTVQVETLEKRLQTVHGEADKDWTEGSGHIEDGESTLQTAAEEANSARKDLMQALFEAGTRVDQASAEGDAAIDKLETVAGDGAARIKAAVDALNEQVTTMETELEHTRDALSESCEVFRERVKQFVDSVSFDTGILIERLIARKDQYTAHLTEVSTGIDSATDTVVQGLGTRVADVVTRPLTLAAENMRIELERLAAAATSQKEAVVKALEGHNQALGELKEAAVPMARGVDEIHEAVVRMRQQ